MIHKTFFCILRVMPQGVAWAGDRPTGPEDARARLLEAAGHCLQRYGLEKTGISDVASEAGVTRRTVYRYFPDRDALISAALVRGVQDFAARARALLASFESPGEMVVEGLAFAVRELPRDPLLGRVLEDGSTLLTETSFPAARAVLSPVLQPLSDAADWSPEQADECGELIMRLALSLIASPRPDRGEEALRVFLRRRLLPSLGL